VGSKLVKLADRPFLFGNRHHIVNPKSPSLQMSSTQTHHQQLKDLLSQRDWDNAQAFWLELAEQFSDQPEFLLLLVK